MYLQHYFIFKDMDEVFFSSVEIFNVLLPLFIL
jgi:hypothetical protein